MTHAICNAHGLRELAVVWEHTGQPWAPCGARCLPLFFSQCVNLDGIAAYATGRLAPDELAKLGWLLSRLVEEGRGVPCHAARVE